MSDPIAGPHLPLSPDASAFLGWLESRLRVSFTVKYSQSGEPYIAVIAGSCPLCVDAAHDDDDLLGELKSRSAYIFLKDMRLRCDNPECRAGCVETGEDARGKPNGLTYEKLQSIFQRLRDEPMGSSRRAEASAPETSPSTEADPTPKEVGDAVKAIAARGNFYNLEHGCYYVPNAGGEPVEVTPKGFAGVVGKVLKVSRRSNRARDAVDAAIDYARAHGIRANLEFVTGRPSEGGLLFHLGNGDVRQVVNGRFKRVPNGTGGVLFKTERDFLPLTSEDLNRALADGAEKFPALHSAILDDLPLPVGYLTLEEQRALLLATWVAIFIRPWATARPHTLLIGQPGCGKTTTQRLFAAAFYGPEGEVGGGVSLDRVAKDLVAGAVHQTFVVRDDVNDLPPGGLDPLCRASTGTKVAVSEFHETLALGTYRARAFFLMSGVNPSWLNRSDLLSRLWIIELGQAGTSAMTEPMRVKRALDARPAIMAETVAALRVLADPLPERSPITRFDALEAAIFPIMAHAGYGGAFENALKKMRAIAARAASRADPMLGYILALAHAADGAWLSAADLADKLSDTLGVRKREKEPHLASGIVRDPLKLAKLLSMIERQGSSVVRVDSRSAHNHTRVWHLTPLLDGGDGGVGGVESPPNLFDEEEKEDNSVDDEDGGGTPPTPPAPPPTVLH